MAGLEAEFHTGELLLPRTLPVQIYREVRLLAARSAIQ